jgi:hypothetical protein
MVIDEIDDFAVLARQSGEASRRLRNCDNALKRAMAMSQVETALLPSNRSAHKVVAARNRKVQMAVNNI